MAKETLNSLSRSLKASNGQNPFWAFSELRPQAGREKFGYLTYVHVEAHYVV